MGQFSNCKYIRPPPREAPKAKSADVAIAEAEHRVDAARRELEAMEHDLMETEALVHGQAATSSLSQGFVPVSFGSAQGEFGSAYSQEQDQREQVQVVSAKAAPPETYVLEETVRRLASVVANERETDGQLTPVPVPIPFVRSERHPTNAAVPVRRTIRIPEATPVVEEIPVVTPDPGLASRPVDQDSNAEILSQILKSILKSFTRE